MAKYSKEFIEEIFERKNREKLTLKQIREIYKLDLGYWMKKYNLVSVSQETIEKRNKISELKWNGKEVTEEWQAYFLGLMMSDGCIIPANGCVSLKLADKDGELELLNCLNQLINFIPLELSTEKNTYKLRIYCTQFMLNIKEWGIVENKTYEDLHIPNIPAHLIRHFIRGYFDGDGTVFFDRQYLKSNICSISKTILEDIQKELNEQGIESAINVEIRKRKTYNVLGNECSDCKDMYRLYVRKKDALEKFKHYLYDNSTICLIRKYKKFNHDDPELMEKCKNFNIVQRIEAEPINRI